MSEPSKSKFFSYEDGDGHIYIVDSLERIPSKYRELAEEVSLEEAAEKIGDLQKKANEKLQQAKGFKKKGLKKAKTVQREVGDVIPFVQELDLPSVAVGFATSLVFFLVLSIVKKTGKMLLKIGLLLAIVGLLAGAYLGWLRRAAGLGDQPLSSPKAVIDDARKAANKFQKRIDDQEKQLEKIEGGSR